MRPDGHFESRTKLSEEIAVRTVWALAKDTGVNVGIAHVSQPHLAEEIRAVRTRASACFPRHCAHYLYLTTEDLKRKGRGSASPRRQHPRGSGKNVAAL
jgi:dihydroorotase-like cyclic amidohydrolase